MASASGRGVGEGVGRGVGDGVGRGVGEGVGRGVGEGVGRGVGDGVRRGVGDGVGTIPANMSVIGAALASFAERRQPEGVLDRAQQGIVVVGDRTLEIPGDAASGQQQGYLIGG
jgi:hypothetical protein